MKSRWLALSAIFLISPVAALAWSGDTWGNITRATIKSNADLMIDSAWVPKNTFTNFEYGSTYLTYLQGVTYTGVAYSQNNPQETWSEFYASVTATSGGSVGYGNDCSGFVSICWRLPNRNTTATFESQLGTRWVSLGETGTAATASLVMGDALNSSTVGHIVLFLSRDTSGVRTMEQTPNNAQRKLRSYSNLAAYRPIRRLQITDAPTFSADGLSRVVDVGSPVSLSVQASSSAPMTYQWRFNGQLMAGATTNLLTISSARLTNAGDYLCVVGNSYGAVTSRVMSLTVYPAQATVFLDNFDTNSAARWLLTRSSTDTRATFSYDYSQMGIAAAPNAVGGTTRGLRLEANLTAGVAAALSLSPASQVFTGDCRLRFDLWMNVNGPLPAGGTGSTEHFTAGLGTAGNRVLWTGTGSTADGYWFAADGEGGASDTSTTSGDFLAFLGAALQNPAAGVYTAGSDSTAKGNLHPYYLAAFPVGSPAPAAQRTNYAQQTGVLDAGTLGFAWHEVVVARRGATVDWAIDGIRLATVTNATFTGNNVSIGYWDSYASLSDNTNLSFGLIDNVRVEMPVVAPAIVLLPPSLLVVTQGATAAFCITASGTEPLSYQWRYGATNIVEATTNCFSRSPVQTNDAGTYSVVVTNAAGSVTGQLALVVVCTNTLPPLPSRFDSVCRLPDGTVQLGMSGTAGSSYVLQYTSDWLDWSNLCTVSVTNGLFWLIDPCATNAGQRFYRLRAQP